VRSLSWERSEGIGLQEEEETWQGQRRAEGRALEAGGWGGWTTLLVQREKGAGERAEATLGGKKVTATLRHLRAFVVREARPRARGQAHRLAARAAEERSFHPALKASLLGVHVASSCWSYEASSRSAIQDPLLDGASPSRHAPSQRF